MAKCIGIRTIPFDQRKTIAQIVTNPVTRAYAQARLNESVTVAEPQDCWNWKRTQTANGGYGLFTFGRGNLIRAHRLAYAMEYGPFDEKLFVRHKCDNPACCNPAHLELGTNLDNVRDAVERGRHSPPPIHYGDNHPMRRLKHIRRPGETNGNSRYTAAQALAVFQSPLPIDKCAEAHGVSRGFVAAVRSGRTWRHVTGKECA